MYGYVGQDPGNSTDSTGQQNDRTLTGREPPAPICPPASNPPPTTAVGAFFQGVLGGDHSVVDGHSGAYEAGRVLAPLAMAGAIAADVANTPVSPGPDVSLATGAALRSDGAANVIFRTGSQTDGALTDASGVSFRDSISSSADGAQAFKPGQNIFAVDANKLPAGSATADGVPFGHVTVTATPEEIRAAVIPHSESNPLAELGLKPAQNPGTYKLPK